jgi:hypothetical protein
MAKTDRIIPGIDGTRVVLAWLDVIENNLRTPTGRRRLRQLADAPRDPLPKKPRRRRRIF